MTPAIPAAGRGQELGDSRNRVSGDHDPESDTGESDRLRDGEHREDGQASRGETAEEVPDAPRDGAAERQERRHSVSVVADGAGRGLRVELVRVVEDSRLGGSCRLAVVMAGNGVEQLGEDVRLERRRAFLDHAHARGGHGRAAGPPRSVRMRARF